MVFLAPSIPAFTISVGIPVCVVIITRTISSISRESTPPLTAASIASRMAFPVVETPTVVPPPTVPTVPPNTGGAEEPLGELPSPISQVPPTVPGPTTTDSGVSISGSRPIVAS